VDVTGKDPVARFKMAVWKPQPNVINHTQEERDSVKGEGHYLSNPIVTSENKGTPNTHLR